MVKHESGEQMYIFSNGHQDKYLSEVKPRGFLINEKATSHQLFTHLPNSLEVGIWHKGSLRGLSKKLEKLFHPPKSLGSAHCLLLHEC